MNEKSNLLNKIKNANKIAIFSHINPDADAICSSLAFKHLIKDNFNSKFVDIFIDGEIGELYYQILRDEVINPPKKLESYDLAIVLDCPTLARIGSNQEIIKDIPEIINIDHHMTNSKFANLNYVAPASSTCEVLYFVASGNNMIVSDNTAKLLYQGIITDTNCFSSLSTTGRTHLAAANLLKYKFNSEGIKNWYYRMNSNAKMQLLALSLKNMKSYCDGKFKTMRIPYSVLEKNNATFDDTLGIVDYALNTDKSEACAILIEKEPNKFYVSLRGKGIVNIGEIAKKFNGGGGMAQAAFQIEGDMKEIEAQLVEAIAPEVKNITVSDRNLY